METAEEVAVAAEAMVEEATEDVEREVDVEVGEADLEVDEVAEEGKENEEETKVEAEEWEVVDETVDEWTVLSTAAEVDLEVAWEDDLTLEVKVTLADNATPLELMVDWGTWLVLTAVVEVAPMVFVLLCLPLSIMGREEEEEDAVEEEDKVVETLPDVDISALETADEASAGRDWPIEALSDATDVLDET